MLCRTLADASVQAQANANASGNAWVFFSDTSGKARCEAAPEFTGTANVRCQRKWSGVLVTVVQPADIEDVCSAAGDPADEEVWIELPMARSER